MSHVSRAVALIALSLVLIGCGRASQVYLRAEPGINPGAQGDPRPVNVRFYQLKTIEPFKTAEFEPLWSDAAAVLGDSLVGEPLEVTVQPGDGQQSPFAVPLGPWSKEAKSLGVLALFSDYRGDKDRRRVVVSAWHANDYVIELTDQGELHFRKH